MEKGSGRYKQVIPKRLQLLQRLPLSDEIFYEFDLFGPGGLWHGKWEKMVTPEILFLILGTCVVICMLPNYRKVVKTNVRLHIESGLLIFICDQDGFYNFFCCPPLQRYA